MSDDIVMRLRASSLAWRVSLMPEAADEIERLRSALDTAIRERDEARAEIERLRIGLHRVSLASQNSMASKDECGRIARETLEGKS